MTISAVCATTTRFSPSCYTGKERDAESGNDYFGARYYASSVGRWLSPDWSAKVEPVPYAKLGDPQTLNLYAYVRNNPVGFLDADGHYTCSDSSNCDSKQDAEFAKSLSGARAALNASSLSGEDLLNAKNALDSYGAANTNNGVTVGFAKQPDPNNSNAVGDVAVPKPGQAKFAPNSDGSFHAVLNVTFQIGLKGDDLSSEIVHEGSHMADRQSVARSITSTGGMDPSTNITHHSSEVRTYGAENAFRSTRGMKLRDTDEILSRPEYQKNADVPLYPDLPH